MPIHFLDNYAGNNLESIITKKDGSPLYGEIWLYKQFLFINENNLLPDETWYLKHSYNLSTNPSSRNKVEGEIDFLLISKYGILIIEVKGGGIRVDENDCYYSYKSNDDEYEMQNPFVQVKEYTHTLKELINSAVFIYSAVIFPHEGGFELKGPQLAGYSELFFSKKRFSHLNPTIDQKAITNLFFDFINELGGKSRQRILNELYPSLSKTQVKSKLFSRYPELAVKEINRLKSELFPVQSSYGFNPDKINSELILNENFEILKGLKRNRKVMVQGAPGTGKTVLAIKFLAENLLKQHKGIFFCANKLIRSKLEHIILQDYSLDPNSISFRIFSENTTLDLIDNDLDFFIFDEAQEYMDNGLFDFISQLEKEEANPKVIILYDPEQSIVSSQKELGWYTDFFIEEGYTHYYFDEMHRCIQNKAIASISKHVLNGNIKRINKEYKSFIHTCESEIQILRAIKNIVDQTHHNMAEKIILVHSELLEEFKKIVSDYFKKELYELTSANINVQSQKVAFTTPLKFRGLEREAVYLFTKGLSGKEKTQNYVGITRALKHLELIVCK